MKQLFVFIFIVLLSFVVSSCYQSDIWDKTIDKKDDTAPALVSVVATNNTQIEVVFSEDVDQQSAEVAGNYTITGSAGFSVISAVRNSVDFTRVTLTTTTQLNMTYTLTVANVKDKFENVIGISNTIMFQGDALPYITSVNSNNNTQIQVVFSEPLFGSGYYRIYNSSMTEIYNFNLTFNSAISATLTTPSQNNSVYYISIDGFYDSNGNYVDTMNTYTFNGDALPAYLSVAPDGTASLLVTFSEPMSGTPEINDKINFKLTVISTSTDISSMINSVNLDSGDQSLLHVSLSSSLTVGESYELEIIPPLQDTFQDIIGNDLSTPYIRSFTW